LSYYLGFYTQIPFSEHFSIKVGVGVNQTPLQTEDADFIIVRKDGTTESVFAPAEKMKLYTLSVSAEPRYYLRPVSSSRWNFYAALPITFESIPITREWYGRHELKMIPSLGSRYELSKHWALEAHAGLGWGGYFTRSKSSTLEGTLEYTAALRLGYTF
jgi:hypothetical protein